MAAVMMPAWQTKELEEEWVDYEDEGDASTHDNSPTQKQSRPQEGSHSNTVASPMSINAVGTVVVHAEATSEGRLPLVHRMGLSKKNIFTPTRLKLETMFQSPSPPQPTAVDQDQHAQESTPAKNLNRPFEFNDAKANHSFPFTFIQPCNHSALDNDDIDDVHQQSKLRLFQFHYDTYTRDHLSAIIDSIPVSASSRSHSSGTTPSNHYTRKRDTGESPVFRAPKRIKISQDDGQVFAKQVKIRVKRNSLPLARNDHILDPKQVVQVNRASSGISDAVIRSVASSTINASGTLRSFDEELAAGMQHVNLVSDRRVGSNSTARTAQTKGTTRVASSATQFSQPDANQPQRRVPSSTTALTCIAPTDISPVPEQIGRMQFDRTQYKWVKRAGEESDDPFRDVESVVDYVSSLQDAARLEPPTIVFNDAGEEILDLTGQDNDEEYGSGEELSADDAPVNTGVAQGLSVNVGGLRLPEDQHTPMATPRLQSKIMPTPIRSALKSVNIAIATTPINARGAEPGSSTGKLRSVSFSDGRRSGRIRDLHPGEPEDSGKEEDPMPHSKRSIQPSFRTKRIADMLDDLDESSQDDDDPTPCKSSSQQRSMVGSLLSSSLSQPSASSNLHRSLPPVANRSTRLGPNATFLTECSFGVAHDRLLQCITDVVPFEPHWEELTNIDLSGKALDSVARLKEFMPKLEDLIINDNAVSWLSGVPSGVRLLSAVSNQLTGLTSYVHLAHLESLDISKNQVDSLLQLECLHRLRELKAEHNQITSFAGLHKLSHLHRLSLIGNRLTHADLSQTTWADLEYLDLSQNALETVEGLEHLPNVTYVNLDDNVITRLDIASFMSRLRCLRVSDNRLEGSLDVRALGNVRILYADRNRITGIIHVGKRPVSTFSLIPKREWNLISTIWLGVRANRVVTGRDVRDIRRLYLSGNSLGFRFLDEPCYNMIYLEMADCQLTSVPSNLGEMIPNVRVLNLNYNFIGEMGGLEELKRLKKLSMIGSRLRGSRGIVRALRRMEEIEMVDFRMNPCTVSWYVPLLDNGEEEWQELDAKFRRGLPDELYAERLVYRGMLMQTCGRLKVVDGLPITDGERVKASELLRRIERGARSGA